MSGDIASRLSAVSSQRLPFDDARCSDRDVQRVSAQPFLGDFE